MKPSPTTFFMKALYIHCFVLIFLMAAGIKTIPADQTEQGETRVSGEIINGYRVLSVTPGTQLTAFTVFRGDYIKFEISAFDHPPGLTIPSLDVHIESLESHLDKAPYFKMKNTGIFAFSLDDFQGTIDVRNYTQKRYREVSVEESLRLIRDEKPLVLDVRTQGEFRQGHLKDAVLIPLQALQQRLDELSRYKNSTILIYCATGNRSTVASKILIDKGFGSIVNMRHGIRGWERKGFPIDR